MVRVFIAPKYDYLGNEFEVNDIMKYVVELDRFPYKLNVGKNKIERNSHESTMVSPKKVNFHQLFKKVEESIDGHDQFYANEYERHCGFPENLLLPKGKERRYGIQLLRDGHPLRRNLRRNHPHLWNRFHIHLRTFPRPEIP